MVKTGLGADLFRVTTAAVELRYESSRITPLGTITDGFVIANSNFTFRPFADRSRGNSMLRGLEMGLHVDNLFNVRYANPGSIEHLEPSIEQNGRTFIVRLTSRF
jgi:outer membrane receptor protein involved in Fe transport